MAPRLLHYSDVENVYDAPERVGRLAGLLTRRRDEQTLLAGTGDNTSPGVLSLVEDGQQALDFFSAVEPDVETFGNHEFDHSREALKRLVAESPQTWVSANIRDEDGSEFAAEEGVVPATTLSVADETVGVVGVTTERTASLNPLAADLDFSDPIESARDALAGLDADYTVVLSHLGRGDEELARAVDADAILGGHVPTEREEFIEGTLLTRPGDGGSVVLEIDLGSGEVTRHTVADAPVHDEVADAMRDRLAETGLNEIVGEVSEPIDRSETTLFGGECRLGNMVADAYRWATGAEVGLQNSGGVRTGDPLAGEVSAGDLVSVTPFEERIAVAEVPGTELRKALAWAAGPDLGFAEPDWWHAQISGAAVRWDPDACEVQRVEVGGEPVEDDRTYSVALSEYVLHTDDEFPSLREDHRVSRGGIQYEVLVEYARETGIDPTLDGRVEET
ncbi:bifunctional metallophosphatase/5'-nucleotidase [Halorussus halophilus]|uniref:bifunctional metallophosphatase/5'-nucleotidase n=1 Tax=Halorussus halophilus TaxID=2650975 RepID=UPI001300D291|nr:5'-nucleotidase C-terminal domain-containing protein [Halorussus halophilus]